MDRKQAIADLSDLIADIKLDHPLRVGIDGVDASGKTMLADELVAPLQNRGRSIIRLSADSFHHPPEIRYRQGRLSPEGYYEDSFNYDAIILNILKPLGPAGNLKYRTPLIGTNSDSDSSALLNMAEQGAILLFDGIFLHRPEIRQYWDFSVFVQASFDVIIKRAEKRDLALFKTAAQVRETYKQRYIPGEKIYLKTERPSQRASVIWKNDEIENPVLTVNIPIDKRL